MKPASGLPGRLGKARLRHTRGVARTALKLARIHGISARRAGLAAWLHDCARELDKGRLKRLLRRAGADAFERATPALWHASVGAWLARHEHGVRDPAVLEAIRFHSTGAARPGRLARLLFVADYTEPGRPAWSGLPLLRRLARKDLDAAYLGVLSSKLVDLLRRGLALHPRSLAAYHAALKRARRR